MKLNAYVPEGGNDRGRGVTPTSISIFDSFDIHKDLVMASKCQHFNLRGLQFHYIKSLKTGHSKSKVLAFLSQ